MPWSLESDIDAFAAWCKRNYMGTNIGKCKFMSFYRVRFPTIFNTDLILDKSCSVLMDPQLSFESHIMIAKDLCEIRHLKKPEISHLENTSSIWTPSGVELSDDVESVQKKLACTL